MTREVDHPATTGRAVLLAEVLTSLIGMVVLFPERATRIELAFSAWEADVLPLNYARDQYMVQRWRE